MADRPFDIVLYGPTGVAGGQAAEHLARQYGPSGKGGVKYALAGRSEAKLKEVVARMEQIAPGCKDTKILIGDSSRPESLQAIASQARAVAAMVGPYAIHGEAMVSACVESGTHYVDITGEFSWVKRMIEKYHAKAQEKKVKLVSCCGFDSMPFDIGAFMCQQEALAKTGQGCQRVNGFMLEAKGGFSGGTVHSLLGEVRKPWSELAKGNNPDLLCEAGALDKQPIDPMAGGLTGVHDKTLNLHSAPFLMTPVNSKIVRRTASLLPSVYGRDFIYTEGMAVGSRFAVWAVRLMMLIGGALIMLPPVQWALGRLFPQGKGPSRAMMDGGNFRAQFVGYSRAAADGKQRVFKSTFGSLLGDPGYKETGKMAVEAALVAALPGQAGTPDASGYLTPASAFGQALVERLKKAGMTLEVREVTADAEGKKEA